MTMDASTPSPDRQPPPGLMDVLNKFNQMQKAANEPLLPVEDAVAKGALPDLTVGLFMRHAKSGDIYEFRGWAIDATNGTRRYVAVYCNKDGEQFVRESTEFLDGRFSQEPLTYEKEEG